MLLCALDRQIIIEYNHVKINVITCTVFVLQAFCKIWFNMESYVILRGCSKTFVHLLYVLTRLMLCYHRYLNIKVGQREVQIYSVFCTTYKI